jgi:CheY-like chemotaxis protein
MNQREVKIMVVDDDRVMLTLLTGIIHREGYRVKAAVSNGRDAIGKFLELQPDIVFLDIEMPVMNGLETLKAIKEYGILSQVVMVSSSPTSQRVLAAREHGAAGFLVKPLSARKVADAIRLCLERATGNAGDVELFVCA